VSAPDPGRRPPILSKVERFTVGGVFGRAGEILARNALPFGGLALAITGLVFLVELPSIGDPQAGAGLGILVLDMLASNLLSAVLIYGTVQELRGRHATIADAVMGGVRALWPVLLLAVVVFLGTSFGMVLFVLPGLVLMTLWWVAIPVAVIERPGVLASLGRSSNLTAGYRWHIFAIVLILLVAQYAIDLGLGAALAALGSPHAGFVAQWIAAAAFTALRATVVAVGYYHLRVIKEGADIEEIAAVFD